MSWRVRGKPGPLQCSEILTPWHTKTLIIAGVCSDIPEISEPMAIPALNSDPAAVYHSRIIPTIAIILALEHTKNPF